MIVVSNSSSLISLARIGQLNLLASFYERILVPVEVHHEVTVAGRGLPGAAEVCEASWIEAVSRGVALAMTGAWEKGIISDLRQAYIDLLRQGIPAIYQSKRPGS